MWSLCLFIHLLVCWSSLLSYAESYAVQAPKTYKVYDVAAATRTLRAPRPRITNKMHMRQLDPDSQMAQQLNSRPTSYASVPYKPAYVNSTEDCVLWDSTCKGDRNAALIDFFNNTKPDLLADPCFTAGQVGDAVCTVSPKPDASQLAYWSTVRNWMREPACSTAADEAHALDAHISVYDILGGCCGTCGIGGPNVDVYYWPSPDANTECLNIIGDEIAPPLEGATTEGSMTYWGVTTVDTDEYNSILTTMLYTSINGVYFKMPLVNPWDILSQTNGVPQGPAAVTTSSATTGHAALFPLHKFDLNHQADATLFASPTTSEVAPTSTPPPSIRRRNPRRHARANPIALPYFPLPAAPSNGSGSENKEGGDIEPHTVVREGHTFIYPSIYVDFFSLTASDDCGYIGSQTVVTSTLLSFAPGELSTYGGPLKSILGQNHVLPTAYNFADLPCPPQSVASAQWYKPERGQPYRPVIAFPTQLTNIDPAWAKCTGNLFTGLDPPRALVTAAAMVSGGLNTAPGTSVTAAIGTGVMNWQFAPQAKTSAAALVAPVDSPAAKMAPAELLADSATANQASPTTPSSPISPAAPALPESPPHSSPPTPAQPAYNPQDLTNQQLAQIEQALLPASTHPVVQQPAAQATQPAIVPNTQQNAQPASAQAANPNPAPAAPPAAISNPQTKPQAVPAAVVNQGAPQNPAQNVVQNAPAGSTESYTPNPASNPAPNAGTNPAPNPSPNPAPDHGSSPAPNPSPAPESNSASNSITIPNTNPQSQHDTVPNSNPDPKPNPNPVSNTNLSPSPNTHFDNNPVPPPNPNVSPVGLSTSPNIPGQVNEPGSMGNTAPAVGNPADSPHQGTPVAGNSVAPNMIPVGAPASPATNIAGYNVIAGPSGYNVNGHNVAPGAAAVTANGQVLSADNDDNLHVGGQVYHDPTAPPAPAPAPAAATIAGQVITPIQSGVAVVAGSSISQGGPAAEVSGTTISLGPSNNVVINGQTHDLPASAATLQPTTIDGQRVIPVAQGVAIGSMTVTAGGLAATISGQAVSLGHSGDLHFGDNMQALPTLGNTLTTTTPTVINGQAAMPLDGNSLSIDGTTLTPGAPAITASDGQVISLGSAGLIVGSSTVPASALFSTTATEFPPSSPSSPSPTPMQTIATIANEVVVPLATGISVDGTTLGPGAAITGIDGTVVSLGTSQLVIGTSTIPVQIPSGTGKGGYTIDGSIAPASPTEAHKGTANRSKGKTLTERLAMALVVVVNVGFILLL